MDSRTLLKEALNLGPADRLQLIEWLAESLDQPDERIERVWAEEAEKRYQALVAGKVKTIPLDEIIKRYKQMEVEFIEPASIELDDAIAYYNLQSYGLGDKFFDEVLRMIKLISIFPEIWAKNTEHSRKAVLRNFLIA